MKPVLVLHTKLYYHRRCLKIIALYFLAGFIIGKKMSGVSRKKRNYNTRKNKTKNNESDKSVQKSEEQTEKDNKKTNVRVRKKMKKYFMLKSNSPQKIDPEKITVNITPKNKSSPDPNFIALSVLWAHYMAYKMGILKGSKDPPWQDFKSNKNWSNFLESMVQDTSWTEWIKKPDEVKKRTILAFENQ